MTDYNYRLLITLTREMKIGVKRRALVEGVSTSEYVRRVLQRELDSVLIVPGPDTI